MAASLRETCRNTIDRAELSTSQLPAVSLVAHAAKEMGPSSGDSVPPEDIDLNRVAAEIGGTLAIGGTLDRRHQRLASWCLWQTEPALAEDKSLLMALLRSAATAPSARAFGRLASAYVREFRPDLANLSLLGQSLALIAGRKGGKWLELQRGVNIFDPAKAPHQLADGALQVNRPVQQLLAEAGLGEMEARGGLAAASTLRLLKLLAESREHDHLRRLEAVTRLALNPLGKPLFDGQAADIATGLLGPFGGKTPDKSIRDRFLSVVISLLGDPRLRPGQWQPVSSELRQLVIRWLTEQSLRQFLDIVDEITGRDGDSERMFRYRRAFWESVYEDGLIEEAWVAFGPDGARMAKRFFGERTESAVLEKQKKPVLPDHAVLLLRVGDGVVAEWSHLGQCNMWFDSREPTAPRLFKLKYGSDDVRIPDTDTPLDERHRTAFSHQYSSRYTWQRKAAGYLYQMTGRRLDPADWAPK